MPASRSPSRSAKPPPRPRSYWPMVLIGLAAVLTVIVAVLPASTVTHFLPPPVQAEDFSGSIWHGSAGRVRVSTRDAGALEWRLHPLALFGMALAADLHWVKVGFVVDATVTIDRHGLTAQAITGGGPLEDLHDLGVAAGSRGIVDIKFSELKADFTKILAVAGDLQVTNLSSAQVAGGADLGGYDLRLAQGAVGADGSVSAQLMDIGGPLEVQAVIRYSPKERTATLSGIIKERPDASPALRNQLQSLSQLRGRDGQGRIPADMEFTL